MVERFRAEVVHVVPPADVDEYELEPELASLAESRYVLVCRKGGAPTWGERLKAFLLRDPIEAVTLVADTAVEEGREVTATVTTTEVAGVYEASSLEPTPES